MDFGDYDISEPMFDVGVNRLRRILPPPREWDTDLDSLLATAGHLDRVTPLGVICHVSRCGSTLLANVVRADTSLIVLSEPSTILTMLERRQYTLWELLRRSEMRLEDSRRRRIVEALTALYCHRLARRRARGVVIKFNDVGIVGLPDIVKWWPNTRVVVLIRNPVEVIVSNMRGPTGWMRHADSSPEHAGHAFGWTESKIKMMPKEERCARVIGRIHEVALAYLGKHCRVADYADLTPSRICEIAEFLGASLGQEQDSVNAALAVYSKDATKSRSFHSDTNDKVESASHQAKAAADRWALDSYRALREESRLCWSR